MAYRLNLSDDLAGSVRRVATEQLDGAIEQLADGTEDPVEAIHDVRKRLKKTRSLVRLARPSMRSRDYRRENRALRERGRVLSGTRDADVMIETIDDLAERYAGHAPSTLFDAIRGRLSERASRVREEIQAEIAAHGQALRSLRSRVDDWPLDAVDTAALVRGLSRSYRRGRDAFAQADASPTTANLHEWRKRVKDLWYQLRLVRDAWPQVIKATADEAKALSQALGDDHDLAVLAQLLVDDPEVTAAPSADRDRLLELIEHRRGELLEHSRERALRLYAESPKAFRRRLRTYARSTAREAAGAPA
jgi:CHAD domain-containing protein